MNIHDANDLTGPGSTERDAQSLAASQLRLREEARQAALKCAQALLAYIRANPRLLFADTLPPAEAEELRSCLTTYVTAMRLLGAPPERVLIAVKELVREAADEANVSSRSLTSASVTWAIAGYFPSDEQANPTGVI